MTVTATSNLENGQATALETRVGSIDPATDSSQQVKAAPTDGVEIVFDSDYQHNFVHRVTPLQSVTFDRRIDVTLRPQALVLSAALLQRQSNSTIEKSFPNANRYQLGDLLDTSNTAEWMLYLVSCLDESIIQKLFALGDDVKTWTEEQWNEYFSTLGPQTYEDYLEVLYNQFRMSGKMIVAGPEGNHDGAAWGNGVERTRSLLQIEAQIVRYTSQKNKIENKIAQCEALLAKGSRSGTKQKRLEQRLSELRAELGLIDTKIEEALMVQEEESQQYFYSRQKQYLEIQIQDLAMRVESKKLSEAERQKIQARMEVLERRLEYIDRRLDVAIGERERAKRIGQDKSFGERVNIIRFFGNIIMGISKNQSLFDPKGYWAQNAGGLENTFDKSDYLFQYLKMRYPELYIEPISGDNDGIADADFYGEYISQNGGQAFLPLSTKIKSTVDGDLQIELAQFDELTHEPLTDDAGKYVTRTQTVSDLESVEPSEVRENFDLFWHEVRPGEYICVIEHPDVDDENSNERFLMVQAFYQGEVNGKAVYNLFLDGMDSTEEKVDIAYFATMSSLQRKLCALFLNEMRSRHDQDVLFLHSSHFPIRLNSHRYWDEFGWPEYFDQQDVAPLMFSGHGHSRMFADETKPTLFGKNVFFGRHFIRKDEPFWGIMVPSTTDAPNEFMNVKLSYDDEKDVYVLEQGFHPILEDPARIDAEVYSAVAALRPLQNKNHYHQYSTLNTGTFSGIQNMLFSQDRIVVYDAVPVSIGQYQETLSYSRVYLDFLRDDLAANDPFLKLVERTVQELEDHFESWYKGNPNSEDSYDRLGYEQALQQSETMKTRRDKIALLTNFTDLFETPAYERLRILIAQTPQDTKAYDFWVVLGLEAAKEESRPEKRRKIQKAAKHAVADSNTIEFAL